jgi:hypothetical protein
MRGNLPLLVRGPQLTPIRGAHVEADAYAVELDALDRHARSNSPKLLGISTSLPSRAEPVDQPAPHVDAPSLHLTPAAARAIPTADTP